MAAKIPEAYLDILQKKAFASLATIMKDGSPQVTPVWFDTEGDLICVCSAKGRVKDINMKRNPNVGISIIDPDNPYRHLSLRGKVVKITEEGADAHIDSLTKKYLNQDKYPFRQPGEVRVTYKIAPEKVTVMG